jgi:hypothetical protein
MHLENSTHVAITCPDTADARNKALTKLAEVHYEIGLQDRQWTQTSPKTRHNLLLGSSPPPEWKLNRQATTRWSRMALPHCAAFALHLQESLPKI